MSNYNLYQGDCLELMKNIPDKSIDMILCDLPYGTTACFWDVVIPFDKLWEHYNKVIKDNGTILLFGREPFSSHLRMSNLKMYKYDWIWQKTKAQGFLNCRKRPLIDYENIMVFYKHLGTYNPQNLISGTFNTFRPAKLKIDKSGIYGREAIYGNSEFSNYPKTIITFHNISDKNNLHPTQKPVELLEYLIRTYTNENEVVLDNCMGSGSTGIACINTKRKFIGIELDENYFNVAKDRIMSHIPSTNTLNVNNEQVKGKDKRYRLF